MADSTRRNPNPDDLQLVADTDTVHHQSIQQKRRKSKPKQMEELNLASMLDVCFQLLIFFVLTASFAKGEGYLPADLPAGSGSAAKEDTVPKQPLHIRIRSLGGTEYAISAGSSAPANFKELYSFLHDNQDNEAGPGIYPPDNPIIIHAENDIVWGHVINAYNAAVRARYENVNFAMPGK